ncbi:MAG TPA: hypothetical protein VIM14_16960 [Polyangia bacterium]
MFRFLTILAWFTMTFSSLALAGGKKPDKKPAAGAEGAGTEKPDVSAVDISAVKKDLVVLSDGKQHYLAVVPFGEVSEHLYYGDGKRFHAQRVSGGGRNGDEAWDRIFWEPRVNEPWKGGVDFHKGKYTVQCGDRATEFKPVEANEQSKILGTAAFFKALWIHRAYSLARDNKGNYYFVDRLREPKDNKTFRLFAGTRGNLKLLKMTNVVSDSQGDIFTTKKGELRLVLDRKKPSWFSGKAETELISLPLEENRIMIYTDLGVYTGQRLGTPCDDLL